MKKKIIIGSAVGILIVIISIFCYAQMKVKNIYIDIDYSKSNYYTSIMRPAQSDLILVTPNSKIKITKKIRDKKLLNGYLKCKSSNSDIISVKSNDTLDIKQVGEAKVYCESILGTKSNYILFSVIEEEV
ncbi:MAG: hypothetical protein E7166_01520 [Firmicutes bacterium]|nr:hypothetical protein [Bacillota bacterium]